MCILMDCDFNLKDHHAYRSLLELIEAKLSQLEAMACIAATEAFMDEDYTIRYNYLSLIHDIVREVRVKLLWEVRHLLEYRLN